MMDARQFGSTFTDHTGDELAVFVTTEHGDPDGDPLHLLTAETVNQQWMRTVVLELDTTSRVSLRQIDVLIDASKAARAFRSRKQDPREGAA